MKVAEIRDLLPEELSARITDTRREIVDLRFQLAANKLDKPHKIREARRLLSQLLTIQTEKVDNEISKSLPEGARGRKKSATRAERREEAELAKKKAARERKQGNKK